MSHTVYRPLSDDSEYPLFASFPPPASGVGARSQPFEKLVALGDYIPSRVWIAERDGVVIARLAFWAPAGTSLPWGADYFDFLPDLDDRIEIGAELMRAAYTALVKPDYSVPPFPDGGRPDYHLFLPVDWHERADARQDAADRIAAAERFGLVQFVERLNLKWTVDPDADDGGLPPRSSRLRFEPAGDRYEDLVETVMRVNRSTLDAHVGRDIVRWGPRSAVERMIAEADALPEGNRTWWRLAYTVDGDPHDPVGFIMPVKSPVPTHTYIGVVPEHRGHHYSDDLVAETLHLITEAGETMAYDATDVGNAPMAASLARCGYRIVGRRIILE